MACRVFDKKNAPVLRVFAFPHAGGNASCFNRSWSKNLPSLAEVVAVQYPGRPGRFRDPLATCMDDLVHGIVDDMLPFICKKPYPATAFCSICSAKRSRRPAVGDEPELPTTSTWHHPGCHCNEIGCSKIILNPGEGCEVISHEPAPAPIIPFVLLGHSLGAVLVLEVARELRRRHLPAPLHIYVSGRSSPHCPKPMALIPPTIPDGEYVSRVVRAFGPSSLLDNPALYPIALPILKADMQLVDSYTYQPDHPLDIPFTAWGGVDDSFSQPEKVGTWQAQSTRPLVLRMVPHRHFFVDKPEYLDLLAADLDALIDGILE
ncbi:putative type I polyketide synthase [Paratrimastix pyriformis]|uniref:Type I polyketide synthase n=1 Tax=Paratrimastix pyriformis TaxID=342808 RepID=A0ABQ8UMQ3_9EUKA|nr:putative type I polyketide synthase [Paratrimastix pyriformis]